jgi:hypothetical protein
MSGEASPAMANIFPKVHDPITGDGLTRESFVEDGRHVFPHGFVASLGGGRDGFGS